MSFVSILRRLRGRWLGTPTGQVRRSRSRQARRVRSVVPSVEHLEVRLAPATNNWTGLSTASTAKWSDPGNWSLNRAPVNGDDLVFGAGVPAASQNNSNDLTGLQLNSLTFAASNYTLSGNAITLESPTPGTGFLIANVGANNDNVNFDIQLGGPAGNRQFFTVGTASAVVTMNGHLSGTTAAELSKDGPGT